MTTQTAESFQVPATMKAQRLYTADKRITIEEVPVPTIKADEVLLKVAYCGICHSDLSLINGTFTPRVDVVTQGHEVSGTIVQVGEKVSHWNVGARVIASAGRPCGKCNKCLVGDSIACVKKQVMAFDYDGGWAQYVAVPAVGLTAVPEGVPMDQAAILADAVATPFGAVMRTAQLQIGESVAVWGVGGVGTHIMQLAKVAGAVPVIAIDINDEVLERAKQLGADYTLRSDDPDLQSKIFELTQGKGVDVAFDAVGIESTSRSAMEALNHLGRTVVVGMSSQELAAGTSIDLARGRKKLFGHYGYRTEDVGALTQLVRYGRIDLSQSISEVVPLDEVERGIAALENKVGNPIRILVKPNED
ncbi:zinc-binding dehydrogenase [Corynebacterium sp. 153RC1]|uniref:zinc-binding dehydrogenase n=1 Tax=unclassified Corynebacterium TaxID=2624378 RepID=UPI00211BADA2|nr:MULTISPECIES: zinc-binding dehydrogenase [unclassified Corynebacterium]MCQ9352720.1 zinc-binding dehydrogenase [Corynebacterium sp. 209RC1]MCQ9354904.1 zinc-binding dehydrogenase [Corynebacterium sp. 1222RC1]MCQ9357089.1 zinc-binding dehydrogenase [Corynebacterium sp. 122RC1]MCQ9359335.1 zinc-binding dehydrogenase [Corynebacterium sp. 142RC1]MCQ9361557.1 zinc-binding dehydrogenase [Corynebacterium sp. 153RC1]